jgi:hypothetical protein
MRLRRALDGGNVTEALSAAAELDFVSLAEALELAAGIEIWVAMAAGRIEALLGQQTRDRFDLDLAIARDAVEDCPHTLVRWAGEA